MVNKNVVHVRIPSLLDVTTYLSLIVMSLLAVSELQTLQSQLMFLGLSAAFGLLYRFVFLTGRYEKNPAIYFGSQLGVMVLMLLLAPNSIDPINFMFLIVALHASLVLTRKAASLWIAVYYLVASAVQIIQWGSNGYFAAAYYFVTYVVVGFFGTILQQAELARQHNEELIDELQSTQPKLQELAVLEERNRLARELHDSVKQQVFAISMQLGAARNSLSESDKAFASVIEAERLAQQAGAELTTLIHELRPPTLERQTLPAALQEHLEEWSRQNDIEVESDIEDNLPVTLPVEQVLFRVAQETLANVARHSKATKVIVRLANENDEVKLTIEDNGTGFDMERVAKGVGLDSMRERLEAVGGQLEVSSQMTKGTRMTTTVRRA
jgi:signal transduction histidine kinase